MKKGNIYTGTVSEVQFPNKGIVVYTEQTPEGVSEKYRVAVKGAVPGKAAIGSRLTKR